jgi:hypothetical protein
MTQHWSAATRSWHPNEDDPPDYWLLLDTARYAVEVTSTKPLAGSRSAQHEVPFETYLLYCDKLCASIKAEALRRQLLHGYFGLSFAPSGAVGRAAIRRLEQQVTHRVLDYMSTHDTAEKVPACAIGFEGRVVCTICKYGRGPDDLVSIVADVQSESATVASLRNCLLDVCTRKASRLQERGVDAPWILLLLNTVVPAEKEPQLYVRAFQQLSDSQQAFSLVFVVWGDGTGFTLHMQGAELFRGR